MAQDKVSVWFNQRNGCFIVGYWNLVAVMVDIVCLVVIAAIVSDGFQCEVTRESIEQINWPWVEPLLVILTLGSQGFHLLRVRYWHCSAEWNSALHPHQRQCYPGMIHVYQIDVFILLVNAIWMKIVMAFIYSVHKKDLEGMTNFFRLSMAKLVLQVIYLAYATTFTTLALNSFWFIQICDFVIATVILIIINGYIDTLQREKKLEKNDIPPPYVETLILAKSPQEHHDLQNYDDVNKISVICDKDEGHAETMPEVHFK